VFRVERSKERINGELQRIRTNAKRRLTDNLDVNVQKASFDHFEHQSHFGSGRDSIEETLFGMSVYRDVVAEGTSDQKQTDDQLLQHCSRQRLHHCACINQKTNLNLVSQLMSINPNDHFNGICVLKARLKPFVLMMIRLYLHKGTRFGRLVIDGPLD
jgi:hypothetical protein